MDKEQYKRLVDKRKPKEKRVYNSFIAFIVGGTVGLLGELLSYILVMCFGMSKMLSYSMVCLTYILIASVFTALGFFDDWIEKGKCGLIIPTTGFAHSVTSSALEYKKEGMITGIGANFFKLAGSVILYGIISAFFLCFLKVICNG